MRYFVLFLLVLGVFLPLAVIYKKAVTGKKRKAAFLCNAVSFFSLCLIVALTEPVIPTLAAESIEVAQAAASGWKYIGAALSTGLSCIGGGIAVASSASAALGALSEDPKIMGKALIFVALAEGVALYGVIMSILILNN